MKKTFFIVICFFLYANVFSQIINARDASISDYYRQQVQENNSVNKQSKPTQPQAKKYSQKDTTNNSNKTNIIQVGVGGVLTSLNFFKNAQQFTYYPAISARIYYQPKNYLRFMVDYSSLVQQVNIVPTWLNVRTAYIDIDAHLLMHFYNSNGNNKSMAYAIIGVSSQSWKSYYTGIDDYNSTADAKIQPNTNYKTMYFGGSLGFGFEYKFAPRLNLYGEIRVHITNTDVGFGLSDVCYGLGVKCTLIDFNPNIPHKKPSKDFKWF